MKTTGASDGLEQGIEGSELVINEGQILTTRFLTKTVARALRQRLPPHRHAKEAQGQSDCECENQRKHK